MSQPYGLTEDEHTNLTKAQGLIGLISLVAGHSGNQDTLPITRMELVALTSILEDLLPACCKQQ